MLCFGVIVFVGKVARALHTFARLRNTASTVFRLSLLDLLGFLVYTERILFGLLIHDKWFLLLEGRYTTLLFFFRVRRAIVLVAILCGFGRV